MPTESRFDDLDLREESAGKEHQADTYTMTPYCYTLVCSAPPYCNTEQNCSAGC